MAEKLFDKVLRHPDKEEIIKKLLAGESVKSVEAWLRKKHKSNKRYQISYITLQNFRKNNLKVEGDVLENIKQAREEAKKAEFDAEFKDLISNSSAYQDKLNEIVSNELDTTRKIVEMERLISSRMEYYFNRVIESGEIIHDKMFIEYLTSYRAVIQDFKKYVEGVPDHKVEHNVNIQIVNDQITILKNIVFETLQELDPSMVPIFIEKINNKMCLADNDDSVYKTYKTNVIDVIPLLE